MVEVHFFEGNPRFAGVALDQAALESVFFQALSSFEVLPICHKGQSKEIRQTGEPGILIQKLSPTIYSYSANRAGVIPGTDLVRLAVARIFWDQLHARQIPTCSLAWAEDAVLITEETLPPVEVIVKAALVGTPAHIYDGIFDLTDRFGTPFVKGELHDPYVRFDYRNPLEDAFGNRMRDECLPLALADRLIDVEVAMDTALTVFGVIQEVLCAVGLQCLDVCLFLNTAGEVICGEISPDNMRIKDLSQVHDYDKDLWRKGKGPGEVLANWQFIQERLEQHYGPL